MSPALADQEQVSWHSDTDVVFGYRQRATEAVKQASPTAFQDCLDKFEEGQVVFGHVKVSGQNQINTCAEPSLGLLLI